MDKLVRWSVVGLKVFGAAFIIGTGYILWGIYGGYLRGADARTLSNLALMGQIMTLGGGLATICLVIVTYDELAYTVVAGLVGGGILFGLPMVVATQLQGADQGAADVVTRSTAVSGEFILFVVGIRILMEIVRQIKAGPTRRAALTPTDEGKVKAKATRRPWYRLSRCWELPYCHPAIRDVCPAFEKKKNCWKLGRGCNCDPNLIEALIRSGGAARGKSGATSGKRAVQEAYLRSDLTQDIKVGQGERTRQCKDCPIYNEHQREKFKVLNPIIIVATVIGLLAAYPVVERLYRLVIAGMSNLASKLAFGTQVRPGEWFARLDTQAVRVFFFIILFLLVLSYVLKFVEWAILVRKL